MNNTIETAKANLDAAQLEAVTASEKVDQLQRNIAGGDTKATPAALRDAKADVEFYQLRVEAAKADLELAQQQQRAREILAERKTIKDQLGKLKLPDYDKAMNAVLAVLHDYMDEVNEYNASVDALVKRAGEAECWDTERRTGQRGSDIVISSRTGQVGHDVGLAVDGEEVWPIFTIGLEQRIMDAVDAELTRELYAASPREHYEHG